MTRIIPSSESLTVEFKSDRGPLSDRDIVLAAVCLANTEGGRLYLGVEDDGTVTGAAPHHCDANRLASMLSSRTVPPLAARVSIVQEDGQSVALLEIPKARRLVASSDGTLQRRRLRADGTPECTPFLPHEFASREATLGQLDFTGRPVAGATLDDLDSLERVRIRSAIDRYGGDSALLGLSDDELDGALGLVARNDVGDRVPTLAGLLLAGKEPSLRALVPTHEIAFQVMDGTEVQVNEFMRSPLVKAFERVEQLFTARVTEREVQVGLFRVPVPDVERKAFREALVNAITHRDYARLGTVQVQWRPETLTISNPGSFVEGVTLDNLLVVEPRPRNPILADAFKRIGLAERTGRGVDLIYKGLLRYGRPAPSYARSSDTSVTVEMSCAEADITFLELVIEREEAIGAPMPLDTLVVLSLMRSQKRVDIQAVATAIQKDQSASRAVLERLVEAGLVEAHGVKRGRTYTLGRQVYARLDKKVAYVRQAGFDKLQQEQMVRKWVQQNGEIRRQDAMALCHLSGPQATRLLGRLTEQRVLLREGSKRWTVYKPGPNL